MADGISCILTDLSGLRAAYVSSKDKLPGAVREVLVKDYSLAGPYIDAVTNSFYTAQPGGLSDANRERCIIAFLAARDADFNLALHMYLALMEGVDPSEIAHILLLSAVYSGVESFSDGIEVEKLMLGLLADRLTAKQPLDAVTILGVLANAPPPLGIRRY